MHAKYAISIAVLLLFFAFHPPFINAAREIRTHTIPIHEAQEFLGDPHLNKVYFYTSAVFVHKSGKVFLSSTPDGTGPINFSHAIRIEGSYPSSGSFQYVPACGQHEIPPIEITQFISKAHFSDQIRLNIRYSREWCNLTRIENGKTVSYANVGPLYLVYFEDIYDAPDPFLRLPWDYEKYGLDALEAMMNINSYFDHEYPLLSVGWQIPEPHEVNDSLVNYKSNNRTDKGPSSHGGFDWGRKAGARVGCVVPAAAGGTATYVSACAACGNAIYIDHGNGYQTRYYHLQSQGLVTKTQTEVKQGDQIGLVGTTGNSDGPHIHFMVIKDKDGDGDFNDNIPDGLVDPFGWQSSDPDPWEEFTFTQNRQEKTGMRSHYLWQHSIRSLQKGLNENGAQITLHRFKLDFPKNIVDVDTIIEAHVRPSIRDEDKESIGSILEIKTRDLWGNPVDIFKKAWKLIINFSQYELDRYKQGTISIFSRTSQEDEWKKETTTINMDSKIAEIQVNHMTEFALMAEKIDTIAPVTTATISGTLDPSGVYTSPVEVFLSAIDEPDESLGIDYTYIKINDKEWEKYTDYLSFSEENTFILTYYSVDRDGNKEDQKETIFTIDFTPLRPPNRRTSEGQAPTQTPTFTPTPTRPPNPSPSSTPSPTPTSTNTPAPTITSRTASNSIPTPTPTFTPTMSPLKTFTPSPTTPSPSHTPTSSPQKQRPTISISEKILGETTHAQSKPPIANNIMIYWKGLFGLLFPIGAYVIRRVMRSEE